MAKYNTEICGSERRCITLVPEFDTLEQAIEFIIYFASGGGLGDRAYIRRREMWASEIVASVNLSARHWIVCLT